MNLDKLEKIDIWAVFWILLISIAWILPNHNLPWTSFHTEAWLAVSIWVSVAGFIVKAQNTIKIPTFVLLMLALSIIPWVQFLMGIIPFSGQAWMSSIYILGFGFSIVYGKNWSQFKPDEPLLILSISIVLASIVSVGLQLYTWFDLHDKDVMSIWSMGLVGNRPYANIGQPNLLALLLIWSLLAMFLFYEWHRVGGLTLILFFIFILIGLSLTASRMGQLVITILLLPLIYWRNSWRSKNVPIVAVALYCTYWILGVLLSLIHAEIMFSSSYSDALASFSPVRPLMPQDARLAGWEMMLNATLIQPWFGYGLTTTSSAQVAIADKFPPLGEIFSSSHNLILDLILWVGWPLGLFLTAALGVTFYTLIRSVKSASHKIVMLMLLAVGIHSMVEYPLQYAFIMIPVGIMIGVVHADNSIMLLGVKKGVFGFYWLILGLALVVTVRDYFVIEREFYKMRFNQANIVSEYDDGLTTPSTLVLTQLEEWIHVGNLDFHAEINDVTLSKIDSLVQIYPSKNSIHKLIEINEKRGNKDRLDFWNARACKFGGPNDCKNQ